MVSSISHIHYFQQLNAMMKLFGILYCTYLQKPRAVAIGVASYGANSDCGSLDNDLAAVKVTMVLDWIKEKSDIQGRAHAPVCSKKMKRWPIQSLNKG